MKKRCEFELGRCKLWLDGEKRLSWSCVKGRNDMSSGLMDKRCDLGFLVRCVGFADGGLDVDC